MLALWIYLAVLALVTLFGIREAWLDEDPWWEQLLAPATLIAVGATVPVHTLRVGGDAARAVGMAAVAATLVHAALGLRELFHAQRSQRLEGGAAVLFDAVVLLLVLPGTWVGLLLLEVPDETAAGALAALGVAFLAAGALVRRLTRPVSLTLVLVALDEPGVPDAAVFLSAWQEVAGEPSPEDLEVEHDGLSFELGGHAVVAQVMGFPIPPSEREEPSKWATGYWPEAVPALAAHRAHLSVAVSGEPDAPLARAQLLARVVAALAKARPGAIAALWQSGALWPVRAYLEAVAAKEEVPAWLWIDLRAATDATGHTSVATSGLEDFGVPEVEVRATRIGAAVASECVVCVARHLLVRGNVLVEGEELEGPKGERIVVHEARSVAPERGQVLKLELTLPGQGS